jgi:uncharacterized membrane protein YccC
MRGTRPRAISWNWSEALRGTICCLPAAVILLVTDIALGIWFAIGVLPVALMGVLPSRKQRLQGLLLGIAFAVMFFLGGVVSQIPLVAVVVLFGVAYGAAILASKRPIGRVVLGLMLPALVIGLSSAGALGLIVSLFLFAGSLWATAVTMLWPERSASLGQPAPAADRYQTQLYALLLASAASLALLLGYAFGFRHLGWAPATVVLVMRPQPDLLTSRGVGRVLATLAGLVFAWLTIRYQPPDFMLAVMIIGVVAAIVATRTSRWYVTPAGTAILVMLLIGVSAPDELRYAMLDRFGEVLLGVVLAYVFGVAIPFVLSRRVQDGM